MEVFFDVDVHFNRRSGKYTRTVYRIGVGYYIMEYTAGNVRFYNRTGNKKYSETNTVPMELIREVAKSKI